MSKTGRLKQNRLPSIGRKTYSTMKFLQRAITILRSHSCILLESFQGNVLDLYFLFLFIMFIAFFALFWFTCSCVLHCLTEGKRCSFCPMQKCGCAFCCSTCSCSSWSSNWLGWAGKVSHKLNLNFVFPASPSFAICFVWVFAILDFNEFCSSWILLLSFLSDKDTLSSKDISCLHEVIVISGTKRNWIEQPINHFPMTMMI